QPAHIVQFVKALEHNAAALLATSAVALAVVLPCMPVGKILHELRAGGDDAPGYPLRNQTLQLPHGGVKSQIAANQRTQATAGDFMQQQSISSRRWASGFSMKRWQPAQAAVKALPACK